ncbi:phosphatidylinositol 3- and 4-kinase family protein [Babesia bovis T2Bo]|uniref:Serine/threonine-protein kinase ATR n=1 Tax=Babesia bovis TaxID=5865 RepID=A7AQ66_BABBO|nr:phosphatidylinositol 3- and 4-kinase family protein [Babesia bovis T2Bo]EDO08700.1 phosphatidylinositol 3- and 4-kinase family protein [Babesia bovis T2Bo]|eukprot:XP_001612268.1 phosphatidylinositol 3- and 4-kinase family protein [Babesia bovis T2Bo]
MAEWLLEGITLLQQQLQRFGLRNFGYMLLENSSKPDGSLLSRLKQSCEVSSKDECPQPSVVDSCNTPGDPQSHDGRCISLLHLQDTAYLSTNAYYPLHGKLRKIESRWNGCTSYKRMLKTISKLESLECQGPLHLVLREILMPMLKQLSSLLSTGDRKPFYQGVRRFSYMVLTMFTGGYGQELYEDIDSDDVILLVSFLRQHLSLLLNTDIDRLFTGGALPVRTIFTWARSVVYTVNLLQALRPKVAESFQDDLIYDFQDLLQRRYGTTAKLFQRTFKTASPVESGQELSNPAVVVNNSSVTLMAILISELCNIERVEPCVALPNGTPGTYSNGDSQSALFADTHYFTSPLFLSSGKAVHTLLPYLASQLLDNSLRQLEYIVSSVASLLHHVSLWQSYSYMILGYCDFGYNGHFPKHVLGDHDEGSYDSSAFLELLDSNESSRLHDMDITGSSTLLRALRLLEELVTWLLQEVVSGNEGSHMMGFLQLVSRTMFVWHIHYYRTYIRAMGAQAHDCDYYATFLKMSAVTLNRYRRQMPPEVADILLSIICIALRVMARSRERHRLAHIVIYSFLRPFSYLVGTGTIPTEEDAPCTAIPLSKDAVLRIDTYAYNCLRSIILEYTQCTNRPYELMKCIYSQLQLRGYKVESITEIGSDAMLNLLKRFGEYDRRRKVNLYTDEDCASQDGQQRSSTSYAFTKCFPVELADHTSVVLVCLATDIAMRCLLRHETMENADIALSFVFVNSMVLLLLNAQNGMIKDYRSVILLLDTYCRIQMIDISGSMKMAVRAPLISAVHLGDSVVEVMLYSVIAMQKCSNSDKLSRKYSVLLMRSLRSMIASPLKDAVYVIKTLKFLLEYNRCRVDDDASSHLRSMSQQSNDPCCMNTECTGSTDKGGDTDLLPCKYSDTTITPSPPAVIDKLIIHALCRYLASVAVNYNRLRKSSNVESMILVFDDIFKAVQEFIKFAHVNAQMNLIEVIPHLLHLWDLVSEQTATSEHLIALCMASESLNRRFHAVAHGVPLLSELTRALSLGSYHMNVDTHDPGLAKSDQSMESVMTSVSRSNSGIHTVSNAVLHRGNFSTSHSGATTPGRSTVSHGRYVTLYSSSAPAYCYHCLQKFAPTAVRGTYYLTCNRCLMPNPIYCQGQIDLQNSSIQVFISTDVPLLARRTIGTGLFSLRPGTTSLFEGIALEWPYILSLLERYIDYLYNANDDQIEYYMERLSNIWSQLIYSMRTCNNTLVQIARKLSTPGPTCLLSMMNKQYLHTLFTGKFNNEFLPLFEYRQSDNMAIMADASVEPGYMQSLYFYDCLSLLFCCQLPKSALPVTEEHHPLDRSGFSDIPKEDHEVSRKILGPHAIAIAANMSTSTITEVITTLLQNVIDSELISSKYLLPDLSSVHQDSMTLSDIRTSDRYRFSNAWVKLTQICNVVSIPINRLAISGLSMAPVRLCMTAMSKMTPLQVMAKAMFELILTPTAFDRLELLHEGTIKSVLCTDATLQHSLDDCDYRLFQLMQAINDGTDPLEFQEQLLKLDKYRFYALVRLLWYATNPHVIIRMMDVAKNQESLLQIQTDYVSKPFSAYLELVKANRQLDPVNQQVGISQQDSNPSQAPSNASCAQTNTTQPKVVDSGSNYVASEFEHGTLPTMDSIALSSDVMEPTNSPEALSESSKDSLSESAIDLPALVEYLQENFVRILEYFVAVWLNRAQQTLNFALKNKRVFYPEIYGYHDKDRMSYVHIARTYNCIAILICLYQGDIDVFCDRLIEVLTLQQVNEHIGSVLLTCWRVFSRKISAEILGLCAPGIAYNVALIEALGIDPQKSRGLIEEIKSRLNDMSDGARLCSYVDCVVSVVRSPLDVKGIEIKLAMLAALLHRGDRVKVPYITREAAAITANHLLELNPFVSNMEHCRQPASSLAEAALCTIAEYSDDFSKTPTTLATECCSILGYVPCDLGRFQVPRKTVSAYVQCAQADPRELGDVVLRDYLIPNMHLQVALYCIQEILKLMGLYKGGIRSTKDLDQMARRWNKSFDKVIRRAIEPYRATSFLRNRSIENLIETCLDVNTVLDIKSFVWWLLKMLPDTCPALPLFRACDLAMVKIPSVLTFLLPYIVESCVHFLDDENCLVIGKRVASLLCNILKRDSTTFGIKWEPPYEVVCKHVRKLDITDQYTSCQAIFNLLDGIKVLADRYRKELIKLRNESTDNGSPKKRKTESGTEKVSNKHIERQLVVKMKRLDSILFAVPELLVAHAAISCGSYARGVMIIEKKLALEPRIYNFNDPYRSLSNRELKKNVVDNGGLDPQTIISLLCRGYLGLGDYDSLVCISTIVLNDNFQRSRKSASIVDVCNSNVENSFNAPASARNLAVYKNQQDVCRAFSYECRGKYREACDVYNRLLKTSQDPRLWASWYRIIQMTGPTVFIKLPTPDLESSAESLIAESITACWKLALWDELDAIMAKKTSTECSLLEIPYEEIKGSDIFLVERQSTPQDSNSSGSLSQLTQCTVDENESGVFWESLMMRDPIDVWFMEQTASAICHLQKHDYVSTDETIKQGFKHLIRPLGLAIRESTVVAMKYLDKIATLNALRLCSRFNSGKYDYQERGFANELTYWVQGSAKDSLKSSLDILGTAKVALELGGKSDAAIELLLSLNRLCRLHKVDVHIPGSISLADEAFSGRSDVILEHALTLQHQGQIDEAIGALKALARNDFEGFYNLVKMYTASNMLIPKRAIFHMREILKAAPQSFKANMLYADYLDKLLDHRLRNARNLKVVLNDSAICSRRGPLSGSVEHTYKITGVDGVSGIFTFVQLVPATINAYLQALTFMVPTMDKGAALSGNDDRISSYCDMKLHNDSGASGRESHNTSHGNSTEPWVNMDIVDILTKVIAILCFYCTPNTNQCMGNVTFENEACQIFANAIMDSFMRHNDPLPQYYWYSVISQLMSRCNHKLLGQPLFQTLVARLVARYPKQALWSTLYFAHSVNSHMRQIHISIEKKAREISPPSATIVEHYRSIFTELIHVAMDTSVSINEKSALRFQGLWRLINSNDCKKYVIIPTNRNLSFEFIVHYDQMVEKSRICGLDEQMRILNSKQKPKRVGFIAASGDLLNFLIKNEVKGDLRKDKRMMEVTQYIAKLLRNQHTGMPLQCYSVVPLSEVAGIIEWVPNMATMRSVVTEELRRVSESIDRECRADISNYATSVTDKNYVESLNLFRKLCDRRPPVLHRAYYKVFKRDPTAWFTARKEFIHTCAVWSILGYIVGLGDRHAENILLNLLTGQIMHVDFDCLFGKGLQLAVPELVPFRMTQNVVCNLGVCGTANDGPFYSQALKFLQTLHLERHKITAILMNFVFDPLIEWHRGEQVHNAAGHSQKVIQCIENKLRGALNVVMPSVEINSSHSKSRDEEDLSDAQALQNFESVAEFMEPREQLQKLIQVATSHAHLSKMFVGWAPWL